MRRWCRLYPWAPRTGRSVQTNCHEVRLLQQGKDENRQSCSGNRKISVGRGVDNLRLGLYNLQVTENSCERLHEKQNASPRSQTRVEPCPRRHTTMPASASLAVAGPGPGCIIASCTRKVGPTQPLSSRNVSSTHGLVQCSIPWPARKVHKMHWVLQGPLHLLQLLLAQSTRRPGKSKLNWRGQRDICIPHASLCTSNPLPWEEEDFTAARQTMSEATQPCMNVDSGERTLAENNSLRSRREIVQVLAALSTFSAAISLPRAAEAAAGSPVATSPSKSDQKAKVFELEGGVKALDVRIGSGPVPQEGETIAIHYYGRLGAKQGWRFDSSYEHKDLFGVPEPYTFTVGSGQVIAGINTAVRSMHVGGIRRVVIPPSQGYQNKEQGPVPPDFFDRQRLYTTIFNPTRLANGEGATLGTVIFDIELVRIQS